MKIQILMSTMKCEHVDDLKLTEKNIYRDIVIVNQTNYESVYYDSENNIKMIYTNTLGTSISRNMAIDNSSEEICLIADDDIKYVDNYQKIILDAFNRHPDADIITFQIQTPDGTLFKQNYMTEERKHSMRTALKGASIEIAFKRSSLLKNNLKVDLEFGLGSRYRIHDDVIFLTDAIKKGMNVYYVPQPIVIHPKESSGTIYNDFLITSKGAAFYRIFGCKCFAIDFVYSLKKYHEYKDKYSFFKFMKLIYQGSLEFKSTH